MTYYLFRSFEILLMIAGNWKNDKRHGQGTCLFADGTRFRGEWEEDAWLQSAAELALTRVSGPGLTRALAGQTASFVIQITPCHAFINITQLHPVSSRLCDHVVCHCELFVAMHPACQHCQC